MKRFGLLGKTLSHSFSKKYFSEKFEQLGLKDHVFELFEIPEIEQFPQLVKSKTDLAGMNVTIPYKEQVMQFLVDIDVSAKNVGAVNVIKIEKRGLVGYNSDYYGFKQSLINKAAETNFELKHIKALVLGTGGASKAIIAALRDLAIPFQVVSRDRNKADLAYVDLNQAIINESKLIVNCSPLGTYPNVNECPEIPYEFITSLHFLFDLVYNPAETVFMKKGAEKGAVTKNGLEMLHLQAEKAWEIWNS